MPATFFYERISKDPTIRANAEEVFRLEIDAARRLNTMLRQAYAELEKRLKYWRSRPELFTGQMIAEVQRSITKIIADVERRIAFVERYEETARQMGIRHTAEEISILNQTFLGSVIEKKYLIQPVSMRAIMRSFEGDRENLYNRFSASWFRYGYKMRESLDFALFQATAQNMSHSRLINRIQAIIDQRFWRSQMIARTELHGIYSRAKKHSALHFRDGPAQLDLKKTVIIPMDQRTDEDSRQLYQSLFVRGKGYVELDEPFKYIFKYTLKDGTVRRIPRIFDTPPDRPNDRSILVTIRKRWIAALKAG